MYFFMHTKIVFFSGFISPTIFLILTNAHNNLPCPSLFSFHKNVLTFATKKMTQSRFYSGLFLFFD